MLLKLALLIVATFAGRAHCESRITIDVTNETRVDLKKYLEDVQIAATTLQYTANLNAQMVKTLQELLEQKKINCECPEANSALVGKRAADWRSADYIRPKTIDVAHKLYAVPLTWNEARKSCEKDGAKLAVPRTDMEEQALRETMAEAKARGNFTQLVFLGIHNLYGDDDWLTVSGTPLPRPIHSVIMSNSSRIENASNGKCAGVDHLMTYTSIDCHTPLIYFCEIR